jgi:hypothetical protein
MFNNPLINEDAKMKITEREQEAEAHRLYRQLGYRDHGSTRWVIVLVLLAIALILTVTLL